ncbi:MAG: hypothetical protein IIA59_06450 [Candidatus Marinimicrobia bacterium]|nr:hypothetical protein [Candidatus Neomarinimicrobiota bacterium]
MKTPLLILALWASMQDAPPANAGYLAREAEFTIARKSGSGADTVFEFRLKNAGQRPMLTFDPACLFRYVFPEVKDNSGAVLKANPPAGEPGCPHLIICIGPGRSYRGDFKMTLGTLYALEPGKTYSVEFTFANEPGRQELRALETIVRNSRLAVNGSFLVGRHRSNTLHITTAGF